MQSGDSGGGALNSAEYCRDRTTAATVLEVQATVPDAGKIGTPWNARLDSRAVACPDCDLLQRMPPISPGGKACCVRCGCTLARKPAGPRDLPLALTVAAAVAFMIANTSPLMDLSVVGRTASTSIAGAAFEMWMQGERVIGVLVAFCAVIAPGGFLLFMLTLLIAARHPPAPRWVGEMLRWVNHFNMWSMLEVMTLGILVALIKIAQLATVSAGIGMFAIGALVLLFPAITVTFDARELWQTIEWVDGEMPRRVHGKPPVAELPE